MLRIVPELLCITSCPVAPLTIVITALIFAAANHVAMNSIPSRRDENAVFHLDSKRTAELDQKPI